MKLNIDKIEYLYCCDSSYYREYNDDYNLDNEQAEMRVRELERQSSYRIDLNEQTEIELITCLIEDKTDFAIRLTELLVDELGEGIYSFDVDAALTELRAKHREARIDEILN
jgi:hypothetical protein